MKKRITSAKAEDMLMAMINECCWMDELYGLIHDKFTEFVDKVEQENEITDEDGYILNSGDVSEDGTEWYDTSWDVFLQSGFDTIREALNQ